MSKTSVLRGNIFLKEFSPSAGEANRILTYNVSTGEVTYKTAVDTSTFISTTLPSAQIIVGNGSAVATAVAMTGDVTISNAGVTAISAGVITNDDINASAGITYGKLSLTGSLLNADINAGAAISYSKLNLTGSLLNADINAGAAITRSKTASGTAYRILANNSSGVMSENAALTASRAIGSDANGQLQVSATTFTQLGYSSNLTGDIQSQLDNEITTKAVNAIVKSPTIAQHGYAITWNNSASEYTLTDPVVQGIPTGGTTRQFLGKVDGTDWNANWFTLLITDIPAITSSADELNILDGATLTVTELNYVDGVTSPIQTQLDTKQSSSLAQNAIWVGNGSNVAAAVAGGTNGYVLTSVGGVPTWQPASGGIAGLTTNRIPYATSSTTLGDDANLVWDPTNKALTVSSATSNVRIHGFGGFDNIFIGNNAGNFTMTTCASNIGIGDDALSSLTSNGHTNTAIGKGAGSLITNGDGNSAFGSQALLNVTTGSTNTAIGNDSGIAITTGSNNTFVGGSTGYSITTGSNNVVIGYNITPSNGSGQLTIQNAIYGLSNTGTGSSVSTGIIGLYSTAAQGSWQKATFLGNMAAQGTAITDGIVVYSKDSSDGSANATLGLYLEQSPEATATFTQTHRLKIWINGTEYWISLDAV